MRIAESVLAGFFAADPELERLGQPVRLDSAKNCASRTSRRFTCFFAPVHQHLIPFESYSDLVTTA